MDRKLWSRLAISDGSLEAIKWIALAFMTVDHVNKFLFNGTNAAAFFIGRLSMPLFVFSLAYNLARPGVKEGNSYLRIMKRLACFGVAAIPAFYFMGGTQRALLPLNIMFTLFTLALTLYFLDRRTAIGYVAAALVFFIGGANVEYWWPAIAFGVAAWWYAKKPAAQPLILGIVALGSLWFVNNNWWALLTIPVIALFSMFDLHIPRFRWIFYVFYPVHLFILSLIRVPMSQAGYLFF